MGVKVDGSENIDGHDEAMIMMRIRRSQDQYWDAARGPGAEPPASPESVLKARVHGLSIYKRESGVRLFGSAD